MTSSATYSLKKPSFLPIVTAIILAIFLWVSLSSCFFGCHYLLIPSLMLDHLHQAPLANCPVYLGTTWISSSDISLIWLISFSTFVLLVCNCQNQIADRIFWESLNTSVWLYLQISSFSLQHRKFDDPWNNAINTNKQISETFLKPWNIWEPILILGAIMSKYLNIQKNVPTFSIKSSCMTRV